MTKIGTIIICLLLASCGDQRGKPEIAMSAKRLLINDYNGPLAIVINQRCQVRAIYEGDTIRQGEQVSIMFDQVHYKAMKMWTSYDPIQQDGWMFLDLSKKQKH